MSRHHADRPVGTNAETDVEFSCPETAPDDQMEPMVLGSPAVL